MRAHTLVLRATARNRYLWSVSERDDPVEAWRALLRAHAGALRAIEADLATRRLMTLGWYDVLLELNSAPGRRLRMQELAARVTLSRTRVSRMVDELEHAGLVAREPDPDDGRASFAIVTAQGRTELRKTAPHYLAAIEEHFTSHLSAPERQVLSSALGRIAGHHAADHHLRNSRAALASPPPVTSQKRRPRTPGRGPRPS